jgi:hypothetical protein
MAGTSSRDKDPLELGGLDPAAISAVIQEKKGGKLKPPSELEVQKEARLASKEKRLNTAPPSTDPKAPASTDRSSANAPPQDIDKSALLDKLVAYKERFPHLKKRNNVSAKSSAEDILDELHYYEMQLGSKQDSNMGAMILHGSMVAVEAIHRDVFNPLGLNLQGLAKVTKDNMAEFQPIVDELMIKYGAGMYMSPEMRLVLSIGALVMTVHGANSGDARIAHALEKMNQPVKVPAGAKDL